MGLCGSCRQRVESYIPLAYSPRLSPVSPTECLGVGMDRKFVFPLNLYVTLFTGKAFVGVIKFK